MRVLGISGSLRSASYNTALLRHAGDVIEAEGAEFEIYDGLRTIPPYDEDDEVKETPEAVARLRTAIADPYGGERFGLRLEAVIDRHAFGVSWNNPLPNGEPALANEVVLTAELQLAREV